MMNIKSPLLLLTVSLYITSVVVSQPSYEDCSGTPNNFSVVYSDPILMQTTTNGKKYKYVNPNDSSIMSYIVIVGGSPYEMGYAYG